MKKVYIISVLVFIIGIAGGIGFFIVRDMTSQIPDVIDLVTHNNEVYKFGDADKKIKLVEFMYTHCPDICPTTTLKMTMLKEDLEKEGVFGDKVQFLTITIDPYRDTPEKMKEYMETFGIEDDGNWIMLTGDPNNIEEDLKEVREVADTFQFQYRDPGDGYFVHSVFVFLINEENRFIKKFPMGEDFDREEVFEKIMKEI